MLRKFQQHCMLDLKIIKSLYKFLLIHADIIVAFKLKGKARSDLVVVRLDAIGDFILWLDSAKEYRRLYPKKKITLIANSAWADLARHLPFWDEVLAVEPRLFIRNPLYRWKLIRKIRQEGFKLAIQPTFSRELLLGDSIIRASGANERVASIGDLSNISSFEKAISDKWYTSLTPAVDNQLMELNRNAEFITHLASTEYHAKLPKLPFIIDLPTHFGLRDDYLILFPGASWVGKQWPISSFAICLDELSSEYGWQIVLCGSAYEYSLCQSIVEQSMSINVINLAGKTSLPEFVEVARGARVLVANDTSAIHIATAVATPSVCVLGGGHFGRFMPYSVELNGIKPVSIFSEMPCYGCNWTCSQPHEKDSCVPCIGQVSVQSVVTGVEAALNCE